MNEITENLKFMNPLEILLNMDSDEFLEQYFLLSIQDQIKFLKTCEEDLEEVNMIFSKTKQEIKFKE